MTSNVRARAARPPRPALALAVVLLACGTAQAPPAPGTPADLQAGPGGPVAPSPTPPSQPGTMRSIPESARLFSTDNAPLRTAEVRVLRERAAWEAAWQALHDGRAAQPAPAVDFAREMVVLVAMGERPSGGHSVRVDGVSDGPNGGLDVHVTRTSPGPGCMSTMVMTAPVDVVRVPRATGAVRPQMRDVAQPC